MALGSSGPPKFDVRNYSYWKDRKAGYVEALHIICWEVTDKAIVGDWSDDQTKYNVRAKNALFDALSEKTFAVVDAGFTKNNSFFFLV